MSNSSPCRRQPSAIIRACSCASCDAPLSDPKSAASRLPVALSAITLSSNRTSASGGRKPMSTPSASHAVGWAASKPARCSAAGQSSRRSMPTGRCSVAGHGAEFRQRRGLELDHLRLVDFVHRRPRRPGKPVRPRVQARTPRSRPGARPRRWRRRNTRRRIGRARRRCRPSAEIRRPARRRRCPASPAAIRVNRSMPTARTSGSANSSVMTGCGRLVAAARAAATMVAVAPTLVARSQVSPSVRVMDTPLVCVQIPR